jgi:hypothetical protein
MLKNSIETCTASVPQRPLHDWKHHLVAYGNPQHSAPLQAHRTVTLTLPAFIVVRVIDMRIDLPCPWLAPAHKWPNGLEITRLEAKIWDGRVSHQVRVSRSQSPSSLGPLRCSVYKNAYRALEIVLLAMDDVQLQFNSNDPSITYYQGWNAGTTSQPGAIAEISFNGENRVMFLTTVESNIKGGTGSFITVFGILPALANSSTNACSSSYILDNGPPTYFSADLTDQTFQNQPLFQPNATLQEGPHILRIINGGGSLELDYYIITPPVSSLLIQVEDTDSSILYAGSWNTTPTVATQPNFDSTLHSTNSPNASLIYSFTGTFIAIYGLYHPGPVPNVSFTVDSSPPAPLLNPPDPITSDISQSLFYKSPVLSAQSHTLTVNVGENNQGEFTVDYLLVQTAPTSSTAASSTATSSTLASKSSSVNVGAIAGGVIGVVAIIILLVLAIVYILRRNRYPTPTPENKTPSAFAQRIRRIEKRLSVSVCTSFLSRATLFPFLLTNDPYP